MKVVFFTGAGISAESGIKTFRDDDGLWYGYDPMEVAHIDSWKSQYNRNAKRETILNFYNERRSELKGVNPNQAHIEIGKLSNNPNFEVHVITQNVDDLHERGGAENILHLHGSLLESKGTLDSKLIYPCTGDINIDDKCEKGSQLRPNIVWFGENVPLMEEAYNLIKDADAIIAVGTSGVVEPAASLFIEANGFTKYKAIVNPIIPDDTDWELNNVKLFKESASTGVIKVINELLKQI